jgi:hypothetical protein
VSALTRWTIIATSALAGLSVVAGLGACGSRSAVTLPPSPIATPMASSGPVGAMPVRPHFEKLAGGRALASGWLRHIALEGGFWALVAEPPGVKTDSPTVIAVLLAHGVSEAAIVAHDGSYLAAQGKLSAGASIRNSGPEILVDRVRLLGRGQ